MSSILTCLRQRGVQNIPVINLPGIRFGKGGIYAYPMKDVKQELCEKFGSFYHDYLSYTAKGYCSLEDAIHDTVLCRFDDIATLSGVDIAYHDVLLRMRFIVDGIDDRVEHKTHIFSSNYIVEYANRELMIHFEKFRVVDTEEWWEYILSVWR
ncbi:MAG: hypothetical protein NC131_17940 [Roseburia sp.]|nr:hypothetical protein [Roseburia sp.]